MEKESYVVRLQLNTGQSFVNLGLNLDRDLTFNEAMQEAVARNTKLQRLPRPLKRLVYINIEEDEKNDAGH